MGQFQNPVEWDKPYHPGNIIAELLSQELIHQKQVQLLSRTKNMGPLMGDPSSSSGQNYVEPAIYNSSKMSSPEILFIQNSDPQMGQPAQEMSMKQMDEDSIWPAKLGEKPQKATFTEIRGKVIKFLPDTESGRDSAGANALKSGTRENAEIQVHIELVQNNTGRVLYEKTFAVFSSVGTKPFSMEKLNSADMNGEPGLSSMNFALNSLRRTIGSFISDKLDSLPLEGEIIAIKGKRNARKKGEENIVEEKILVNLGSSNGVRIGDLFQVAAVGLKLNDLYTTSDLGDVYVRVGVIKIIQAWEGTAEAMSVAGENYKTGFLVRSMPTLRRGELSPINNGLTKQEEEVPWWDFHGIRSVN